MTLLQARLSLETELPRLSPLAEGRMLLLDLLRDARDYAAVAELLVALVSAMTDDEQRLSHQAELAGLYLTELNEAEKAESPISRNSCGEPTSSRSSSCARSDCSQARSMGRSHGAYPLS